MDIGETTIIRYDQTTGAWIFIAIFSTRLGPTGGGTMVDLKGRFRSPLTATIDSSGQINIGHHSIEEGKE